MSTRTMDWEPQSPVLPSESEWLEWRRRLGRDLRLAAACYSVAHLLFGLRWGLVGGAQTVTADIGAALLLFLIGTIPLWKELHTLCEPVVLQHPLALEQAGRSLVLAAVLAFSPCVWWFLYCRA